MTDMEMYKKLKIVDRFIRETEREENIDPFLDLYNLEDLFESAYEAIDEVITELMEREIRNEDEE